MLYGVVIEKDFGQERFFTDMPINILKNGKANDVPLVIGMTKNEFDTRADCKFFEFITHYNTHYLFISIYLTSLYKSFINNYILLGLFLFYWL